MPMVSLLCPAHLPIQNINEFYNGLLHPFIVPYQVMAMLLAGFLASQTPERTTFAARIFMVSVLVGILLSAVGVRFSSVLLPLNVLLTGIVIVIRHGRIPIIPAIPLGSLLGFLCGMDSNFDDLNGKALWWCLLGCFIALSFATFYIGLLSRNATRNWQHIGIRVLSSWICAVTLLMLTLEFTPNPQ